MNTEKYNGWTNYETWNVALWMDNEQGTYDAWRQTAKEMFNEAEADKVFTKKERATLNLMDAIKEKFDDGAPDLGASTYADLLNAAMSQVHWYEIASHLMDEVLQKVK